MPKQKDLKRLVRSRMQKTGESYTTSRTQLLRRVSPSAGPPPDCAGLAGMSDKAVREKTGRTWPEWVAVLDRRGAATMPHPEIARIIHEDCGLPGWWAQTVTVG